MKIRLVIPECKDWDGWYCKDAESSHRIRILEKAAQEKDIDLIVTSHNFLSFYPSNFLNAENFIKETLIPLLNDIPNKKPIILGFDLLTQKRRFNTFNIGIDSVVCFLNVDTSNTYLYETHILECWKDKNVCSQECFLKQNPKRVVIYSNYRIGLLSCGDIAGYCHNYGMILPQVDVYVDLSHKSLSGHTSQRKIPPKIISSWGKSRYVLVTQQVKDVLRYIKKRSYPFIFPQNTPHEIQLYNIDKNKGVFIDLEI